MNCGDRFYPEVLGEDSDKVDRPQVVGIAS